MIRTETNAVAVEREIREFCTRKWKRYGDRLNERKRRFKNNSELCVSDVWDGASCQGEIARMDLGESVCPHLCYFQDISKSLYSK